MLKPKQEKCITLMVMGNMTQREIAGEIGVTPATICNWRRDEDFKRAYDEALRESVKDMAAVALREEVELLSAKNEMVRLMAARDILDRAGIKPQEQQAGKGAPVVIFTGCDQIKD